MKKLLIFAFSLLLVIACQKAENILEIVPGSPDATGAGNLPWITNIDPANMGQLVDQDAGQSGIQGMIIVTFSDVMDDQTMTASNIEVKNTTTNSNVTISDVEYYPEVNQLYIYIDDAPSGSAFLIRLNCDNMTNNFGSPLDFDRDNNADGSPYDDYLSTFWTTGSTDTLVSTIWAQIQDIDPYLSRTILQQPIITIDFANTGVFGLDTNTLVTGNFSLVSGTGTSYPLQRMSVSGSQVQLQPTGNLPFGQNYTLTITCGNIKKLVKSTTPNYIKVLDGDADGPESAEPDTGGYFRVDTLIPPTITSVSSMPGDEGATFTFSDLIDQATISLNTVMVYDSYGFVPGNLRIYTDAGNNYTMVDYYYKRTISPVNRRAFVSKDVEGENGYQFDGDGNEIGGESWDDYNSPF
jgi:hypothetical protein